MPDLSWPQGPVFPFKGRSYVLQFSIRLFNEVRAPAATTYWTQDGSRFFKDAPPAALHYELGSSIVSKKN